MGATSPTGRPAPPEEERRFAWSGPILGSYPAQTAADQAAVFIRTDARSELACDAFRGGCCCTLLLYQALEPWAQDFELLPLTWGGAMGIRTPDLLHAMQWQHVHGSASVQVTVPGRPHQSLSPGIPGRLLYFRAVPSRAVTRAKRSGSAPGRRTLAIAARLYPSAGQDRRREPELAITDEEWVPPAIMPHAGLRSRGCGHFCLRGQTPARWLQLDVLPGAYGALGISKR